MSNSIKFLIAALAVSLINGIFAVSNLHNSSGLQDSNIADINKLEFADDSKSLFAFRNNTKETLRLETYGGTFNTITSSFTVQPGEFKFNSVDTDKIRSILVVKANGTRTGCDFKSEDGVNSFNNFYQIEIAERDTGCGRGNFNASKLPVRVKKDVTDGYAVVVENDYRVAAVKVKICGWGGFNCQEKVVIGGDEAKFNLGFVVLNYIEVRSTANNEILSRPLLGEFNRDHYLYRLNINSNATSGFYRLRPSNYQYVSDLEPYLILLNSTGNPINVEYWLNLMQYRRHIIQPSSFQSYDRPLEGFKDIVLKDGDRIVNKTDFPQKCHDNYLANCRQIIFNFKSATSSPEVTTRTAEEVNPSNGFILKNHTSSPITADAYINGVWVPGIAKVNPNSNYRIQYSRYFRSSYTALPIRLLDLNGSVIFSDSNVIPVQCILVNCKEVSYSIVPPKAPSTQPTASLKVVKY